MIFEKENWVWFVRPWYRLSEDTKTDPLEPGGDDNPDIADYMGHAEYGVGYDFGDYELSVKLRQNFSTSNGAVQVNLTTPLYGKLKGYVTFFNGYGDSLIDYNHNQTRFGLGIALNNMF
ncbi:phospholipase A1 [Shewanella benthica KT99]|uniref:Phospholipase A1 n=1 Tax=Shewanella benthica KT99 TaxID=314608 RepID=A9D742_9GAMM|nr:phospholipase A1 [Shewanella benthica KT99]